VGRFCFVPTNEEIAMIKVGDALPDVTLQEYSEVEGNGCSIGPNPVKVREAAKGKTIALFALPGAFTPTCSAKHLPGFVTHAEAIKGKGVDQIACLSVNDAFVMDAWGKAQNVGDKVLMLADGNADFSKAVGLTMDGTGYGMGLRSQRYAMVVDDGVVKALNVEAPGAFEVSSAEAIMKAL
jgi:peroxiredoxin